MSAVEDVPDWGTPPASRADASTHTSDCLCGCRRDGGVDGFLGSRTITAMQCVASGGHQWIDVTTYDDLTPREGCAQCGATRPWAWGGV